MSTTMTTMETVEDQSLRDFSEPQLKPAPLRLPKSQSSNSTGCNDTLEPPSKHVRIEETAIEIHHEPNNVCDETPSSPKACTSDLAALVSKFETLGSVRDTKTTQPRPPLDLGFLKPSEPRIVKAVSGGSQSTNSSLKNPAPHVTSSFEAGNNAIDRVSAATRSLASILHHMPATHEAHTTVKSDCHTNLNLSLGSSGISED
jgi:hypothetical protein